MEQFERLEADAWSANGRTYQPAEISNNGPAKAGLSGLLDTVKLMQDLGILAREDREEARYNTGDKPATPAPGAEEIAKKVAEVLRLKGMLAGKIAKEEPIGQTESNVETLPHTDEMNVLATQIESAVGFLKSIPPEDESRYMAMVYGIVDTLDSSNAMAWVRKVWEKVPSPIKGIIAASPETATLLGPLTPLIHFLVKSGLLHYDESFVVKGEKARKEVVGLGKYAGLLYKPLAALGVLAEPIIAVLDIQDRFFKKIRSHIALRNNGNLYSN